MLIDSHCHLPHQRYEIKIDEILSQAKEEGVVKFINVGTSVLENKKVLEVAQKFENVFPTVGIYPHENVGEEISDLLNSLEVNLKEGKKIVAIGECGIDISDWKNGRDLPQQEKVFEMQVELAIQQNLPLMLHNRNGDEVVLRILKRYQRGNLKGVAHCFSSSWEVAKKFLDLGFYISFSGMITYPGKNELYEVVKKVPDNRFLLETDAPYLPPQGHRGEVNYPKYVKIVAEKASLLRQMPFEEISLLSYDNTCRLFQL